MLSPGEFFRRVETISVPADGEKKLLRYSGACNHCTDPACVAVCPTGAMYVAQDGTVVHKDQLCIGCGRCVYSCPYGVPSINASTGYAQKCDACASKRARGEQPACVTACPTRALRFGDVDEFRKEDPKCVNTAAFLPKPERTNPSLVIRHYPLPCETAAALAEPSLPKRESSVFRQDTQKTYVILGGGAAAVTAAKAIRDRDQSAAIRLIARSEDFPYCRPMLSKARLKGYSADAHIIADRSWAEENVVELLLGCPVAAIDPEAHTVTLENGRIISYDKCIYALGAECFIPPIPGHDRDGVYTIRHNADFERLRQTALTAKHAVVIGGGVIGLETVWQLKEAGISAAVIEVTDTLMGRLINSDISRQLEQRLEQAGIPVVTGASISAIAGGERIEQVVLSDGRSFPADFVVMSTGVRANVALARQAGLEVNRSIVVNSRMETSAKDIYACGDCAEYKGMNSATWTQSVSQGEIAGINAAGGEICYQNDSSSAIVHTAGTSLFAVGDLGKGPLGDYETVSVALKPSVPSFLVRSVAGYREDSFLSLCFSNVRLVGAALLGDLKYLRFLQDCVQRQTEKADFFNSANAEGMEFYEQ